MRKEYDLIFGLGVACSCSQTIRHAGLQLLSFPFDWITPVFKHAAWYEDVRRRTDLLCSEFENWLRVDDFRFRGAYTNGMDKYRNDRLGLMFIHDVPSGSSFPDYFPRMAEKYRRRCSRLLGLIRRSKNVLLVRVERPDLTYCTPIDDCRYARKMLAEHFAPTRFDFVLLQCDSSLERGKCREELIDDGILRLTFDYRNLAPDADVMQPDLAITSAALRERFTVREYRTPAEIAARKAEKRLRHYAKYGASNYLQYRWHKLMAALGIRRQ